jgi:flavodoxin
VPKGLVLYYSKTGNPRKMAEAFTEGLKQDGVTVFLKNVKETNADGLLEYEEVAIGSPTHYGDAIKETPNELDEKMIREKARRMGKLVDKLFPKTQNLKMRIP